MFYQVKTVYAAGGTEWDNVDTEGEAKALAKRNKSRGAKVEVLLLKGKRPEDPMGKKAYRSEATIRQLAEKVAGGTTEITTLTGKQGGGWMTQGKSATTEDRLNTTRSNYEDGLASLEANKKAFAKNTSVELPDAQPRAANMPDTSSAEGVFNQGDAGDDGANPYNDDDADAVNAEFQSWLSDVNDARAERKLPPLATQEAFAIFSGNRSRVLQFGETMNQATGAGNNGKSATLDRVMVSHKNAQKAATKGGLKRIGKL